MPEPAPRGRNPYATAGVERGPDGIARYTGRPASLVQMLRATVERDPEGLAVAEIGGDRVSYAELWERAARVAGGLRGEPLPRNPAGKVLKAQVRDETEWGEPLR